MKTAAMFTCLLLAAGLVQAQTMYRWVDQNGKVHYGDRPPPPKTAREVKERPLRAPAADSQMPFALRQAAEKFPVQLITSESCGAPCQQGRDYLQKRGIPFGEKAIATDEELTLLRQRLGGAEPMAPILFVGEKSSKGFLESAWGGLLDTAGYPKSGSVSNPVANPVGQAAGNVGN